MKELKLDRNRKRVRYCPCGKSNRDGKFVPFIDYDNYGYCFSCSKTFRPDNGTLITPRQYKQASIFYYDPSLVIKSGRNFKNNNLVTYLLTKFSKAEVKNAITKYLIGTSTYWPGATIFWQFDEKGKVRNGKIMLYHVLTGRRSKSHFNTVKSALKIADNGHRISQCLFGLHLINEYSTSKLGIVESEKSAIVLSILYPQYVWLATGGKNGFSYEKLKPIKKYKIVTFPDKDAIEDWTLKAEKLCRYGFRIEVNDMLNKMDVKKNADLADIFLVAENDYNRDQELSPIELKVNRLASKNPNIWLLINEFELTDTDGNQIRIISNTS